MNSVVLAYLGLLIAIVSVTVYVVFWIQYVRRTMLAYQEIVEEAKEQLSACKKRAEENDDLETLEILERSEDIYRQAVDLYNKELRKLWIYLPASLMGFRRILRKPEIDA